MAAAASKWLLEQGHVDHAVVGDDAHLYREQFYGYDTVQSIWHNGMVDGDGTDRQYGLPVFQAW